MKAVNVSCYDKGAPLFFFLRRSSSGELKLSPRNDWEIKKVFYRRIK